MVLWPTWIVLGSSTAAGLAIYLCCRPFHDTNGGGTLIPDNISIRPAQSYGSSSASLLSQAQLYDSKSDWNLLHHLGGNSPWFQKSTGIANDSIETPVGCHVDQVHMMSRHAERYPTLAAGIGMLELYQRIQHANVTLTGDLAFANDWDFFMPDPAKHLENLVSTGPHAGTLGAFASGVTLRTRYPSLIDDAITNNQTTFWASDSKRVVESARYFGTGLYGIDVNDVATLKVIPETADRGADTLTPGKTCLNYANNVDEHGREYGARKLYEWQARYLPGIIGRLAVQNPGLPFTDSEVYSMQELCGFETIAKGSSKWCQVFRRDEWEDFEYARDLLHFYRTGQGNPYSAAMGMLWLNATAELLREGPDAGPLFVSFVHDGDIIPMLTALALFPQTPDLPSSYKLRGRAWRTSDIVPMGSRILFERLVCSAEQQCRSNALYPNHVYCEQPRNDTFVRINVNDGIVAIPGCDAGPGSSCPIGDFLGHVRKRGEQAGDFGETCGLEGDAPAKITFLHQ